MDLAIRRMRPRFIIAREYLHWSTRDSNANVAVLQPIVLCSIKFANLLICSSFYGKLFIWYSALGRGILMAEWVTGCCWLFGGTFENIAPQQKACIPAQTTHGHRSHRTQPCHDKNLLPWYGNQQKHEHSKYFVPSANVRNLYKKSEINVIVFQPVFMHGFII